MRLDRRFPSLPLIFPLMHRKKELRKRWRLVCVMLRHLFIKGYFRSMHNHYILTTMCNTAESIAHCSFTADHGLVPLRKPEVCPGKKDFHNHPGCHNGFQTRLLVPRVQSKSNRQGRSKHDSDQLLVPTHGSNAKLERRTKKGIAANLCHASTLVHKRLLQEHA